MERSIVEGFQNLHVLPDAETVDSLARDFTLALDESSPKLHRKLPNRCPPVDLGANTATTSRHPIKKRRFKKRKSAMSATTVGANISDGLDSSCSDSCTTGQPTGRLDIIDGAPVAITRLSDSDDLRLSRGGIAVVAAAARLPLITIATAVPQLVESDSVTENWSPLRPQRRRRHLRRMAVDLPCEQQQRRVMHRVQNSLMDTDKSDAPPASLEAVAGVNLRAASTVDNMFHGKRKRGGVKDRSSNNSFDLGDDTLGKCDCLVPVGSHMQECASSSVSSIGSEPEVNSNEEAVDGDDEQSDFYAESECPGATGGCSGPEDDSSSLDMCMSVPWWQKHESGSSGQTGSKYLNDLCCPPLFESSSHFSRLLRCHGIDLMSPMSRSHFRARSKIMAGREFQAGRRRIKDRGQPPYSFTSFLQDRQLSGCSPVLHPSYCSNSSSGNNNSSCTSWHQSQIPECLGGTTGPCPSTDSGGGGKRHRLMATSEHIGEMASCSSGEFLFESTTPFTAASVSSSLITHQSMDWPQTVTSGAIYPSNLAGLASDAATVFSPTAVSMSRTVGRSKSSHGLAARQMHKY